MGIFNGVSKKLIKRFDPKLPEEKAPNSLWQLFKARQRHNIQLASNWSDPSVPLNIGQRLKGMSLSKMEQGLISNFGIIGGIIQSRREQQSFRQIGIQNVFGSIRSMVVSNFGDIGMAAVTSTSLGKMIPQMSAIQPYKIDPKNLASSVEKMEKRNVNELNKLNKIMFE